MTRERNAFRYESKRLLTVIVLSFTFLQMIRLHIVTYYVRWVKCMQSNLSFALTFEWINRKICHTILFYVKEKNQNEWSKRFPESEMMKFHVETKLWFCAPFKHVPHHYIRNEIQQPICDNDRSLPFRLALASLAIEWKWKSENGMNIIELGQSKSVSLFVTRIRLTLN